MSAFEQNRENSKASPTIDPLLEEADKLLQVLKQFTDIERNEK